MRSTIIVLILLLLGIQFKLWLGDGSVKQWLNLERKLAEEEQQNQLLAARNRAVEADILELKSGEQALEEQARYELGMVKEGEVFYQCRD
jgi:cell division protein FtsB